MNKINPKTNKKWLWLKHDLLGKISSGEYAPGDLLPGELDLCEKKGVSRTTVRQALNVLENEGFIERQRGRGTYVKEMPANTSKRPQDRSDKNLQKPYALLIPEISRPIFAVLARGFDEFLSGIHQQMMICHSLHNIYKQGDIILQLLNQQISGVAIVPPIGKQTPVHQVSQLQNNRIPVVFCHRGVEGISAPLLCWDSFQIGKIAAKEIIRRGHKQIGFVAPLKYSINEEQFRGFSSELSFAGIPIEDENVLWAEPPYGNSEISGITEKDISKILTKKNRPTAVYCTDTSEAEKLYMVALQKGLKVPRDISIVSSDDKQHTSYISSKLALVCKNEFELGYKAAELLNKMNKKKIQIDDDRIIKVNLEFTKGNSLKKFDQKETI